MTTQPVEYKEMTNEEYGLFLNKIRTGFVSESELDEFESNLIKSGNAANITSYLTYTRHNIPHRRKHTQGRWAEAEAIIIKEPMYAVMYARDIIHDRWEEAEETIAKCPANSLQYAIQVLNRNWINPKIRFEKGEEAISNHHFYALKYAYEIIQGRWEKGEKAILKNKAATFKYVTQILKKRWVPADDIITKKLIRNTHPNQLLKFAKIIKARLPEELHNKMLLFSLDEKYKETIKYCYLDKVDEYEANAVSYVIGLSENERKEFMKKVENIN